MKPVTPGKRSVYYNAVSAEMNMRIKRTITRILTLTFVFIVLLMIVLLYERIEMRSQPDNLAATQLKVKAYDFAIKQKDYAIKENVNVSREHDIKYLHYEEPGVIRQLEEMKEMIQEANERQHLINNNNFRGLQFDHTVLVVRVQRNSTYLALFFDSIRRIVGIRKSLLIFAHDHFDEEINNAITTMQFARSIQIFYPYSVQLHPNVYPGEDARFCVLNQCFDSKKRDPILSQAKLFWWWVVNQVFDHIGILENYEGYIYFLETEQYLTKDFIVMAKLLERVQKMFCSECRFLSLGSSPPRKQLYRPRSTTLVISAWGWSNYSNSGFGFNRTTWNEIKHLQQQYCYFKDPSWENSMKHLATKTPENQLYMLYIEAPRFFPLTGCGAFRNGTDCDLNTLYSDIITFIPSIRYWEGTQTFSVKFDSSMMKNEVEGRGQWGDARDIDLCMFFSSGGSRIFY